MGRDQHLVIGQGDDAGAVIVGGEGGEELGHALHAALRLELLYLLDEMVQVLRGRGDHGERNIRAFADAAHDMVGRDAHDAGVADGLGRGGVAVARERHGLGEAVALGHGVDHRLLAGLGDAVELHPAADGDEKGSRRVALAENALLRFEHDSRGWSDDVLHRLGFQTPEYGNARDDLQVAGAGLGGHAGSLTRKASVVHRP